MKREILGTLTNIPAGSYFIDKNTKNSDFKVFITILEFINHAAGTKPRSSTSKESVSGCSTSVDYSGGLIGLFMDNRLQTIQASNNQGFLAPYFRQNKLSLVC